MSWFSKLLMTAVVLTVAGSMTLSADSVDDIFNRAGKWENATSIKIPKLLVRLGLTMGKANNIPGKIDDVRVLDIEDVTDANAAQLSDWLDRISAEGKLQQAVRTTENGEKTTVWMQYDGTTVKRIVIADMEKGEFSLVEIKGTFHEKELRKFVGGNNQ